MASLLAESVALANPAQNWQDVGRALEELFLMQDNYRTSSIDFKPRIPYGSFQVKSTPSGLLIDADAKTLQAQALMRHALTRQSRTIELPSANVERRRKLSSSLRSSAKGDPAENVCLKLGRLVAMQQGQVDRFASKMLQIYPARDLEVAERRLRESPTDSLSAPSGRAEELLHRVHRFLTQISWKLVEANPDTVNESKEFGFDADFCFDMTHRLFEAALLERHGDLAERLLFAASACAAAFEDDSLVHEKLCDLQKTYRGRGIPPALFGAKAHPQFCTDASCGKELGPGKSFAWGWEEAVEVMNRLTNESLPTAKVETILECVAEIHRGIASSAAITMSIHEEDAMGVSSDGIEDAASFHIETKSEDTGARSRLEKDATETLAETTELEELDGSAESISPSPTRQTMPFKTPKAVGADDFVPIFIYVIACSNLRQPWTLHKFMSTLASDSLLSTEAKYWLTVLESGLFFLANAEF
ncbi:Ras and Rab interactor 2 [Hondaea fermentalgiana]|uniref:Ras and Rab interactor 2 n=1 Tax=Hondaea fermentalgiana TaxID=2315210 RepID=A0A2R5G8S3_9STRA|nr:Ras and Rab interactor 2 [Hondaea fermentalgiana]|eukprot:GBG24883.1 Ras and Rab interactor 2 [Hondaea fermentalgiana]